MNDTLLGVIAGTIVWMFVLIIIDPRKAEGLPSVREMKIAKADCERNLPRTQTCIPKVTWEVITP